MGQSAGQTVTQEVDPQYANRLYTLYGDAQRYANQTPYTPYGGQGVAGYQPFQQAAQNYLSSSLGFGNLGFQAPQRYQTNAGQFAFSPVQEYQTVEDGITRYINPEGLMEDANNAVVGPTTNTVDPNDPNFPWGGDNRGVDISQATFGGPQIQPQVMSGKEPTAPGPITDGFNPAQPDSIGQSGAGPWSAANTAAQGAAMGMLGYQAPYASDGMDRYTNPWQQQVIDGTVSDMLRSADMAAEQGIFSKGAGTYGGDRMGVQAAEMQRNTMDRIGNTVSQLRSQGFDTAARNAQMDASRALGGAGLGLQAAGQLNQFGTDALRNTIGTASAMNQMGAQNQALAQQMMDYDRSQFYEARDYPYQQFGLMQGILSGVPVGMSTYYPGGSRGGGMAGGAMTGAGIGSAFGPWGAAIGGLGGGLLGAF